MIELDTTASYGAKIRVVGVGGGGGNAINSMISRGLSGVDFIAANTDVQALRANLAPVKIQVGKEYTRGLGAGADPSVGEKSIEENIEEIKEAIGSSDMIFVTAGMGGGTGTGGAPVVARIGREMGALVVGIVTKPFQWEARKRNAVAECGIEELRKHVDALIVIPNQKLMSVIDKKTSFKDAFQKVDDILYNATRGIADIISGHGYINVDFADVRTIMKGMGDALMGIGSARGENRAREAAENALNSPLLEGISIKGAQGVLVNISAGSNLAMFEIDEAIRIIESAAGDDVNLIQGIVLDESLEDEIRITVVATGFEKKEAVETVEVLEKEVEVVAIQEVQQAEVAAQAQPAQVYQQQAYVQQAAEQQSYGQQQYRVAAANGRISINSGTANGYVRPTQPVAQTPQPTNVQQQPSRPSYPVANASPTGVQELQKFDEPAYLRRNNGATSPLSSPSPSEKTTSGVEKPAFLRKIMD
jgi:cell division protein FtsZ